MQDQLVLRARARSATCVLAIVIPSVRMSVLVSCSGTESSQGEIETPGFHCRVQESLVSCEQIS